jgi:protein-L-isoaspartate(D-aspartate) O-methyltransferase
MRNFLTRKHRKFWKSRDIDWFKSYFTDHSHRNLIIQALKNIKFGSIIEIGCGAGYNLYKIKKEFPRVEIGGIDISQDAIDTCNRLIPDAAVFEVSDASKIFLSDKSVDVILTDMAMIYIDPWHINKTIKEIKRVARNNILMIEFHSQSWKKRQEFRLKTGYNAYNWFKLLEKHGFRDIEILRLSKNDWVDDESLSQFRYIITAKV